MNRQTFGCAPPNLPRWVRVASRLPLLQSRRFTMHSPGECQWHLETCEQGENPSHFSENANLPCLLSRSVVPGGFHSQNRSPCCTVHAADCREWTTHMRQSGSERALIAWGTTCLEYSAFTRSVVCWLSMWAPLHQQCNTMLTLSLSHRHKLLLPQACAGCAGCSPAALVSIAVTSSNLNLIIAVNCILNCIGAGLRPP